MRRKQHPIFSSQQPVKHQTVQKWSERTNPPSGAENRLFWLSSIFKTSFLGLMTGCGKNKKIKRVEDPMITASGLPRGLALSLHWPGPLSECADKAGLRGYYHLASDTTEQRAPPRTLWQPDHHLQSRGIGQRHFSPGALHCSNLRPCFILIFTSCYKWTNYSSETEVKSPLL